MDETDHTNESLHARPKNPHTLRIEVDFERYAHFLDDSDLTEEQKRQLLQAAWEIVVGFVDLGFGVDAVQAACGQKSDNSNKPASALANGVKSSVSNVIGTFANAHQPEEDEEKEGARI